MWKKKYTLLAISFLSCFYCLGQESNYRAHVGVGLIDVVHVGIARRVGRVDLGPQLGYLKHNLGEIVTAGISGSYAIRYSSKFSGVPTVYVKQLLNYAHDKSTHMAQWRWLVTESSIGRNFYFGQHFGVSAEGGFFVTLYQKEETLFQPEYLLAPPADDYPSVFPSVRVQVFARF